MRVSVKASLGLLEPRDRQLFRAAVAAQILLSLMDLLGVVLLGAVGLVAGAAGSDEPLPSGIQGLAERVGLPDTNAARLALGLGAAAAVVLALKSVVSLLIQRWVFTFLADRTGDVASRLASDFFSQPLLGVQRRPSQWTVYAFIDGLSAAVTATLSQALSIASDVALLVVLGAALMVLDPMTTVVALAYLGTVVLTFNRWLGRWSARVSRARANASIGAQSAIQDAVATYREVTVAGRREYFRRRIVAERRILAEAAADASFIGAIPRYGMETALVAGAALIVAVLLLTRDTQSAVGGLFLFLAAASRVVPALLRLNTSTITLRYSTAGAERTFELMEELSRVSVRPYTPPRPSASASGPAGPPLADIRLAQVSLCYPGRDAPALTDITLQLPPGRSMALVGPTGSGKSSLADVLLGTVEPTSGAVFIGDLSPSELIATHPGAVAYVPQDVALIHGTVRANVALGLDAQSVADDIVWAALEQAHLAAFVRDLPQRLDTEVGDRGVRLSGGQRQRLGLARALYLPPRLLVLDEATSALDAETERAVADTVASLGAEVTTVTIAHRLATIRHCDVVVYLAGGRVEAVGTFDEVRAAVPSFERQAALLGL